MASLSRRQLPRRRRRGQLAAAVVAVAVGGLGSAVAIGTGAGAATVLGDDFEDGDLGGWSKSGGDWSIERDGSLVLHQGKAASELARQFRGSADWTLTWTFPGTQRATGSWNATVQQSGQVVTARNASYNARVPAGGSVSFGPTVAGPTGAPSGFALNGVACG